MSDSAKLVALREQLESTATICEMRRHELDEIKANVQRALQLLGFAFIYQGSGPIQAMIFDEFDAEVENKRRFWSVLDQAKLDAVKSILRKIAG